jgi:hypothetical protein
MDRATESLGALELAVRLAIDRNWDDTTGNYLASCSDKDIALFLNLPEEQVRCIRHRQKGLTRSEQRERVCVTVENDLEALRFEIKRSNLTHWCKKWSDDLEILFSNAQLAREKLRTVARGGRDDTDALYRFIEGEIHDAKDALCGAVQVIMNIRKEYRDNVMHIESKIEKMYSALDELYQGSGLMDDLMSGAVNVFEALEEVDESSVYQYKPVFG